MLLTLSVRCELWCRLEASTRGPIGQRCQPCRVTPMIQEVWHDFDGCIQPGVLATCLSHVGSGVSEPVKIFCLHASPANRQRRPTEDDCEQDDDRAWDTRRNVGHGISGMLYVDGCWFESPVSRATTNRAYRVKSASPLNLNRQATFSNAHHRAHSHFPMEQRRAEAVASVPSQWLRLSLCAV